MLQKKKRIEKETDNQVKYLSISSRPQVPSAARRLARILGACGALALLTQSAALAQDTVKVGCLAIAHRNDGDQRSHGQKRHDARNRSKSMRPAA